MKHWMAAGICLLLCLAACRPVGERTVSGLCRSDFQREVDGQPTDLYVLTNPHGMEVCVTNYGARVVSLLASDRNGQFADVVCGFPTLDEYLSQRQNFGATVGRYIGRILNARFEIDSVTYHLQAGSNGHTGHGGDPGFACRVWTREGGDSRSVRLGYRSPDGENGFPGNLHLSVTYRLTDDNALELTYEATTDAPTVLNPSHHSFFNVSGDLSRTVCDQLLWVDADRITPYDEQKCVTGAYAPVAGTPFDFRTPRPIGERIDEPDAQLAVTRGYDHAWELNARGDDTRLAAWVLDTLSGRRMEVYTTEPGVHIYTANGLSGKLVGKGGVAYPSRSAVCFETMHFQDSPNKPQFPSTVLRPGEVFRSRTVYRFTVVE